MWISHIYVFVSIPHRFCPYVHRFVIFPLFSVQQFATGRVLAAISSRPGQSGRADGYLLEGPELDFYSKQIQKKKTK